MSISSASSSSSSHFTVLALYKFFTLPKPVTQIKAQLEEFLRPRHARGLLLLAAREGMNGTLSYPSGYHEEVLDFLKKEICQEPESSAFTKRSKFKRLRLCVSYSDSHVFNRLNVKERQEIVSMGLPMREIIPQFASSANPQTEATHILPAAQLSSECSALDGSGCTSCKEDGVGIYVPPGPEWHALLQDPKCLVIDTRNEYEVSMGSFVNATNPHTTSFTEFPEWFQTKQQQNGAAMSEPEAKHILDAPTESFNKIAMFCTGGIRCEKASAYCLANSAKPNVPVYHLDGGILAYLQHVPEEESMWHGECFVFDQRISVTHGLCPSQRYTALCHACRHPLTVEDMQQNYMEGVWCPFCVDDPRRMERRQRYLDRQKQIDLAAKTDVPHLHDPKEILTSTAPTTEATTRSSP